MLRLLTQYNKMVSIYDYSEAAMEKLSNCPGCHGGAERFQDFGFIDRYGYNAQTTWCNECGLIFVNPKLILSEYTNLLFISMP